MNPQAAPAAVYLVSPDGTGDFPTIQSAVDACQDGDVIELTDGIFTGSGNRDIDYLGRNSIIRSQSNNPESCILDCDATPEDHHRAFCLQSGESLQAALSGVGVRNGSQGQQFGGGVCCMGASITISDCIFENCEGGGGGAVCVWYGSLILTGSRSHNNRGTQGGGVFVLTEQPGQSLVVTDCTFQSNEAGFGGGGIDFRRVTDTTTTDCEFVDNRARWGGGLACDNLSTVITARTFRNNSANVAEGRHLVQW